MKEIPSFFKKPDPITDIADTKEYDIVVISAGSPGRRGKVRLHARSCFRPQGQEGASRYVGQEIRRGRSLDD